jgi:hypothetical protein
MTRQQANHLLNAVKQGALVPIPVITEALKATGDLAGTWENPEVLRADVAAEFERLSEKK